MGRMLAALAVVLFVFPAVTAQAKRAQFSTATMCEVLRPCMPPPQYAKGPFLERLKVVSVTLRQVQSICGGGGASADRTSAVVGSEGTFNFGIMGCAQLTGTTCVVHVPSDVKAKLPELYALILAHELGHCRGWVHAHY